MTVRKRHSPEQVVRKLAQADRMLAEGKNVARPPRTRGRRVLLSRSGVMAVEVKYLFGQRRSLRNTPRLADHVAQTVDGAARTRRLLRSRGVDVPVAPLLVLAGPGAPDLDGKVITEGSAQIAAFRDSDHWLATLATRSPRLNLPTARAAADTLLGFQDQRRQHEAANRPLSAPGAGEPAARTKPVAKRRPLRVGGGS